MAKGYLTFKRFHDVDVAKEVGEQLGRSGISYLIEDERQTWNEVFVGKSFGSDVKLKLLPNDFLEARNVLAAYYKQLIADVKDDYYLFDFTEPELIDIIKKPDEWGELDYQLAQQLLAERGIDIEPETIEKVKETRSKEMRQPLLLQKQEIIRAYASGLFGGVYAIFFGYGIAYSKKTLLDGTQVFSYEEEERKRGEKMMVFGFVCMIAWIILILYFRLK